jgi:hypothetical protein
MVESHLPLAEREDNITKNPSVFGSELETTTDVSNNI